MATIANKRSQLQDLNSGGKNFGGNFRRRPALGAARPPRDFPSAGGRKLPVVRALVRKSRLSRSGRAPPGHDVVVLVDRLDRDDEVVAVGDHHVRHLVEGLPENLDSVDLENLGVVSGFNV